MSAHTTPASRTPKISDYVDNNLVIAVRRTSAKALKMASAGLLSLNVVWRLAICCLLLMFSYALELNWIPSDPDGPLPQSQKYRERYNYVCIYIHTRTI